MERKRTGSGSGTGSEPGSLAWYFYFLSVLAAVEQQKRLVKKDRRQDAKKARQMGRWGSYRNRVPLTDNTQWAEISDSRKIACVVPHNQPLPLHCFR